MAQTLALHVPQRCWNHGHCNDSWCWHSQPGAKRNNENMGSAVSESEDGVLFWEAGSARGSNRCVPPLHQHEDGASDPRHRACNVAKPSGHHCPGQVLQQQRLLHLVREHIGSRQELDNPQTTTATCLWPEETALTRESHLHAIRI